MVSGVEAAHISGRLRRRILSYSRAAFYSWTATTRRMSKGSAAFEQSFVLATVISCDEAAGKRVLDAGSKAIDLMSGSPQLASPLAAAVTGIQYILGGDEHGILTNVPQAPSCWCAGPARTVAL